MTTISILIPTLRGRERWLDQAVSGYLRHTSPEFDLEFVILRDRPTCGIGWQEAAERAHGDFLHFSNDDVYPWQPNDDSGDWATPLIGAVNRGHIAAPWIQHGTWGQFYAAPEGQVLNDWAELDHSAMPFMARGQFHEVVSPICATHYGVDNWIAHQVHQAGLKIIGRGDSVLCHFASPVGRRQGEWTEQDLLDYDCCIALPEYKAGIRPPKQLPPDRLTPEGLQRARRWREENIG